MLGVGVCNGSWSGKSLAVNKHEAHEAFCCSWIPVTVWEFIRKPITDFAWVWFLVVLCCRALQGMHRHIDSNPMFFFLWHLCFVLFCVLFIWEEPQKQLGLLSLFQVWVGPLYVGFGSVLTCFESMLQQKQSQDIPRLFADVCWIGQWYQSPGDTCYITLLVLLISLFLIRYESFYCAHTHTYIYIYISAIYLCV